MTTWTPWPVERVQVRAAAWRRGSCLRRSHLGDAALVQDDAADHLHVVVAHAERAHAGLAARRRRPRAAARRAARPLSSCWRNSAVSAAQLMHRCRPCIFAPARRSAATSGCIFFICRSCLVPKTFLKSRVEHGGSDRSGDVVTPAKLEGLWPRELCDGQGYGPGAAVSTGRDAAPRAISDSFHPVPAGFAWIRRRLRLDLHNVSPPGPARSAAISPALKGPLYSRRPWSPPRAPAAPPGARSSIVAPSGRCPAERLPAASPSSERWGPVNLARAQPDRPAGYFAGDDALAWPRSRPPSTTPT